MKCTASESSSSPLTSSSDMSLPYSSSERSSSGFFFVLFPPPESLSTSLAWRGALDARSRQHKRLCGRGLRLVQRQAHTRTSKRADKTLMLHLAISESVKDSETIDLCRTLCELNERGSTELRHEDRAFCLKVSDTPHGSAPNKDTQPIFAVILWMGFFDILVHEEKALLSPLVAGSVPWQAFLVFHSRISTSGQNLSTVLITNQNCLTRGPPRPVSGPCSSSINIRSYSSLKAVRCLRKDGRGRLRKCIITGTLCLAICDIRTGHEGYCSSQLYSKTTAKIIVHCGGAPREAKEECAIGLAPRDIEVL